MMKIFYGDLHGHSILSDGFYVRGDPARQFDYERNTPVEYFRYARDEARLDFVALTDHAPSLDQEKLGIILDEAERWNEPGRFVALGGYEWPRVGHDWSQGDPIGDHTCVYFPGRHGTLVPYGEDQGAVSRLRRQVEPDGALAHAAHPSYWGLTDWRMDYGAIRPNAAMAFTELDSVEGQFVSRTYCCEYPGCEGWHERGVAGHSVQEGLCAGCVLGFVGESDSHDGLPGTGPLTGIRAEHLDRASIFRALRQRRVFATTGARIGIEDFTIGGCPMGSRGAAAEPKVELHARIAGTAQILAVELVSGFAGAPVPLSVSARWEPGRRTVAIEQELSVPRKGCFWYLRILQADGHRAWSSPIWLSRA